MNLPQPLHEGVLLRRLNRFAAEARLGQAVRRIHVANSGRLGELLHPGARILAHPVASPARSTTHDLVLVRHEGVLVSVDSRAPAAIAAEAFLGSGVPPLSPADEVRREVTFGRGRIDLSVRCGPTEWLVEVKGCTLVRDGTAVFPDAPTARGRRHVEELAAFAAQGGAAMVLFVIQRSDARRLQPNWETDPGFSEALGAARDAGVALRARLCAVTEREITLGPEVPVDLRGAATPRSGPSCA